MRLVFTFAAALFIAFFAVATDVKAQTNSCTYVAVGTTQNITAFTQCRSVTVNSVPAPAAGVAGVCAPTNIDAGMWQSFYDNPPPGVTIGSCNVGCSANQTINWTISGKSCTALSGTALNHGDTRTVTDSAGTVTGTRNIQCNNGSYTQSGGTCVESCSANQTVNWTISSVSCTADSGAVLAHGGSRTITDSVAPATGTRNISCSNGVLSNSGGTCTNSCPSSGFYYSLTNACYYFSSGSSASCDSICSGVGLVCNADRTKDIGSDDPSAARCSAVATGLTGTSVTASPINSGNAGCYITTYKGGWLAGNYYGGPTTCAASGITSRACACDSGGGGGGAVNGVCNWGGGCTSGTYQFVSMANYNCPGPFYGPVTTYNCLGTGGGSSQYGCNDGVNTCCGNMPC